VVLLEYLFRHLALIDRRGPSLSAKEYPAPFVSDPYLSNV